MVGFYLRGLALGIILSLYALLYFKYATTTTKTSLRFMWLTSHAVMLIMVVYLSAYVMNREFPEIQSRLIKVSFLLAWFLPYTITGVWCLRRLLKGKHET